MSTVTPLINLKPTNPTQEVFGKLQKFGLQPYDRSPNDYLRFVAKIFTAWRDPDDKIINFDPFDDKYLAEDGGKSTVLQATSDKSIVAYIDGFQVDYYFTRLTTDAESTDLTSADNVIETANTITYVSEAGETITINKAKYGEYHRFKISSGICFIDNQLIQISEDTEWWFRIPEITKDSNGTEIFDTDENPTYELGQFIVDQTKVYSLLPNKRYKLVLSYEYITQFESNIARIQFITGETAVDEPYLLLATFSTDKFGMVHQTSPVNEENTEIYLNYITKMDQKEPGKNLYYLRDIDNQYLDKKFMANHKNLFKHLQSQLLTVLADSKIANTFHVKEIKEEIDHSVSSGDFVYYDAIKNRWFPAAVSRQDFDRVHGLYLKNVSEGTDLLFTGGIIEVDNTYKIVNAENMVLKNLIPGQEYFLVDDLALIEDKAPFIAPFEFTVVEDLFSITVDLVAKASGITVTLMNNTEIVSQAFDISQHFILDPNLGEQRIDQSILWILTDEQKALIPKNPDGGYSIINPDTGLISTEKIQFKINLEMVLNELEETRQNVIDAFESQDLELNLELELKDSLNNEVLYPIKITSSDTSLQTMNLVSNLIGPKKPVSNLLAVLDVKSPKEYNQFLRRPGEYVGIGDTFLDLSDTTTTMVEIRDPLINVINSLNNKLNNSSPEDNGAVYGLNKKLALLGSELSKINYKVSKLDEALELTEHNYTLAKMEFQTTATELQEEITIKRNIYLGYYDTRASFVSQKEVLIQKYNAVNVKIDELKTKRNGLQDTRATTNTANVDTENLFNTINDQVIDLTQQLRDIETSIVNYTSHITFLYITMTSEFTSIINNTSYIADFRSNFYRVMNLMNSDYDLYDYSIITPRLLHCMYKIKDLTNQKETKEEEIVQLKIDYELSLDEYTNDMIGGVLTFAEQLLRLQDLKIKENIYNDKNNELSFVTTELNTQQNVREKLYELFEKNKNAVKGELFAKIDINTNPVSTWADTSLVTFTAKIDRALSEDVEFKFAYKQDTNSEATIIIPAGQLSETFTVYLDTFPTANLDNGMPKWEATIAGTTYEDEFIVNLNKYNEKLLNDYMYLKFLVDTTPQKIFTLDLSMYNENPTNRDATPQNSNELNNFYNTAQSIYDKQLFREDDVLNRVIAEDSKAIRENEIVYLSNYLIILRDMINSGISSVNNYTVEIDNLNILINYYTTTTDRPLSPSIPGSDLSKDTIIALITTIESSIIAIEPLVVNSKNEYSVAVNELTMATDASIGQYIATIQEISETIADKKKEKVEVKILYDLYEEKVNILNAIYDNLISIKNSGIFNGEWVKINTLPLNSFEYQEGLENILIETADFLSLLPYSSFDTPKDLEYICSPNGIAYPTDLQSWIFSKSSGKISTRRYPGATSVGIALNNNTLLLNIHHNSCGDISEFLNVYGNATDFISQLDSIYNSKNSIKHKTGIIFTTNNLNKKLVLLDYQLTNNAMSTTRLINGAEVSVVTNLSSIELDHLDKLTSNINNRELLLRLMFAKYYGDGEFYNPTSYLFGNNNSNSSYYATLGNPILNDIYDIFNPEFYKTFDEYTEELIANTGALLNLEIMKDLFLRKNPLYKDLDIINYILAALPEPLFNYQARHIELKENYTQLLLMNLQKERMIIFDNPGIYDAAGKFIDIIDNFENPAIIDPVKLIPTVAERANYNLLAATKQQDIDDLNFDIDAKKLSHDELVDDIKRFTKYKFFYNSIKFSISKAIEQTLVIKDKYVNLKNAFTEKLLELDQIFLLQYKKTDKIPNIMWDIFRITNGQRTKWNYTYLVLRIKGMQQELNNSIAMSSVQYSPINSELNELKIKKNAALTDGSETLAFVYQTEIDTLTLKKNQFQSILDNYVEEFNNIQRTYNYPVISSELVLQDSFIIEELYMQDPSEYDLTYEFSPYPAYKEIL